MHLNVTYYCLLTCIRSLLMCFLQVHTLWFKIENQYFRMPEDLLLVVASCKSSVNMRLPCYFPLIFNCCKKIDTWMVAKLWCHASYGVEKQIYMDEVTATPAPMSVSFLIWQLLKNSFRSINYGVVSTWGGFLGKSFMCTRNTFLDQAVVLHKVCVVSGD